MNIQFRIEHHHEVTSTSDIVRQRLLAGDAQGLVVRGDIQTKGRGRLGRRWSSPAGNLYCSILLRPDVEPAQLPSLSLVVGLKLARAIGPLARLKWPNDVLIDDAKTAGILLEAEAGAVIVGIGVNITNFPDDLPYDATCLAQAGIASTAENLLSLFLNGFPEIYATWQVDGFEPFRDSWLALGPSPGQLMRIRDGDSIRAVTFDNIAPNGSLIVRNGDRFEQLTSAEFLPASA